MLAANKRERDANEKEGVCHPEGRHIAARMTTTLFLTRRTRLEGDLSLNLRDSHISRCRSKSPVGTGWSELRGSGEPECRSECGAGKGHAKVRVVEEIVGIEPELKVHSFGDLEVFPDTHVAAQKARSAESIAANHGTNEVCRHGELIGRSRVQRLSAATKARGSHTASGIGVREIPLGELRLQNDSARRPV